MANDDITTPTSLVSKKIAPIFEDKPNLYAWLKVWIRRLWMETHDTVLLTQTKPATDRGT